MSIRAIKQRNWRKRRAYAGGPLRVPKDKAVQHITTLRQAGMGLNRISDETGIAKQNLSKLLGPHKKYLERETERRILAVELAPAPHALVDGMPTRRRLQALARIGWPWSWLDRERGAYDGTTQRLATREGRVFREVHDEVAALYDRLSMSPPKATSWRDRESVRLARKRATERDWPGPLAWDDIDNPDEQPQHKLTADQRHYREHTRWIREAA